MRVLIIQTAFIGDVVLATGILEKLHRYYPDAHIDFLVRKGNEALFQQHPYLNDLLIWDKKNGKWKDLFRLLKIIRSRKYDKVINVQRFAATGLLTAFSAAAEKIGYSKNPLSFLFDIRLPHIVSTAEHPKHETERCNDLIRHFTDDKVFRPYLYPAQEHRELVEKYQSVPYIVIAPASVWFTKQYPAEKWVAFLKHLDPVFKVFIIGAKSDQALASGIIQQAGREGVTSLCGELNFLSSAALMEKAVMNFVNDSAPMHFASAVNAPVTAIYCSTIPSFGFGPLSEVKNIVEIEYSLPCRPCGLHGHAACPQGHFKCAMEIREAQLLSALPE